jgi:hypothetical protein
MFEKDVDVKKFAEQQYVEPAATVGGCVCEDEHHMHVALSEQRGRPEIFWPDHKGLANAYCGTFGRRCCT